MLGRKPDPDIRRPMQWTAGNGAGFTTGTPWRALNGNFRDWNVAGQTDDPDSMLSWYRSLVHARNGSGALRRGDYFSVPSSTQSVMAFLRVYEDEVVLVAVNTSDAAQNAVSLSLPPGMVSHGQHALENLLRSEGGTSVMVTPGFQINDISLEGHGAVVYQFVNPVNTEVDGAEPPGFGFRATFPNPARDHANIRFQMDRHGPAVLELFDILGRRIHTIAQEEFAAGLHTVSLDTGALAAGVYVLRLRQGDLSDTRRLVVAR
ncbi:hypothetical protein BH23BAC4_BH23BAC4_11150 [soil metagenome]